MSKLQLKLTGKPSRLGIIFNPENKSEITYGELIDPIVVITDEDELKEYYHAYIDYLTKKENLTIAQASSIAAHNVGYSLGYFSRETRLRVERVLDIAHPFLGKARENDHSPEEILKLGMEMGKKLANK